MALLDAGYWQTTYWPSSYWQADYWLEYGTAAPSAAAVEVGVYPPLVRKRRVPLTTEIVLVSNLAIARHSLTVQLLCELLGKLVYEGYITASLKHRLIEHVQAYGTVAKPLSAEAVAVAQLVNRLQETVRLEGRVDKMAILQLLQTLENM